MIFLFQYSYNYGKDEVILSIPNAFYVKNMHLIYIPINIPSYIHILSTYLYILNAFTSYHK